MKYSKRYVAFTILMVMVFFVKFHILAMDNSSIDRFRGGSMDANIWNPMIAEDVNGKTLRVTIDNKEYTSPKTSFYMNENREIMAPVSLLRDAFNCSARLYDETMLRVEKRACDVKFWLDELTAENGEETIELTSGMIQKDGEYYISLNDLSKVLGYNYNFNMEENAFMTADTSDSISIVPTRYDLRERGRVSMIRNQGSYGTCWGFAAISALESSIRPEQNDLYSVDHMTMSNSFNITQYDGGKYTMGMAYLAAWQGPVYEADDPYGDDLSDDTLSEVKHVQEMRVIAGKDYEAIKAAVYKYGGVQTSLYSTLRSSQSNSSFYNKETNSYCYIGTEMPNHDVVIIGWDDKYSKDNFSVALEGDGAFICQNSWGTEFGEDGIFYVSYYDTNIGTHNVVYTRVDDADNYDHIYQSDLCGWVGEIGCNREDLMGANVFTARSDEEIAAASFYATGANTEYVLYVVDDFTGTESFANRVEVASGTLEQAGYYTIDFDKPVEIAKDHRFAIVLSVKTPGSTHPMAIEYQTDDPAYASVIFSDGEGYISRNGGRTFTDVTKDQECNLCIKAFTNNK